MPDLQAAIARAIRFDSIYWSFLDVEGLDPTKDHEVEIRIDAAPAAFSNFNAPSGWSIASLDPRGMIFLRRRQLLTSEAVRSMFVDALTIAHEHSGRFHSWMHEPNL